MPFSIAVQFCRDGQFYWTKTDHKLRGCHGHDGMVAGLQKHVQSVPITTNVVTSNHGKVYSNG
jgi:uncharacterized protein YycO